MISFLFLLLEELRSLFEYIEINLITIYYIFLKFIYIIYIKNLE